jgi:hypothetical protein
MSGAGGRAAGPIDVRIRRARPDEARAFRALRLRALADAPEAFSTTLAEAEAMPATYWEQRVSDGAAGVKSVMMVAVDAAADAWLGMTVGVRDATDAALGHVVSVWVAPEVRRSASYSSVVCQARRSSTSLTVRGRRSLVRP